MSQEYTYDDDEYSDLHKEAYGFRPRESLFYGADPDTKQKLWDGLVAVAEREYQESQEREAKAKADFDATIAKVREVCNCDWIRAFEILAEAENVDLGFIREKRPEYVFSYDQEVEGWLYHMGVSFHAGFEYAKQYHDCVNGVTAMAA